MTNPEHRSFSARLDCHYLLSVPSSVGDQTPLVITLHGFGSSPEVMLPMTRHLFGTEPVIAALEGPNQFFLAENRRDVGFGWITSRHPAESIRLHHQMVLHVLHELGMEFAIGADRRFLAGFSQSVALNYRFAATHPEAIRGIVGLCGGLPGDWESGSYQPLQAAVLHIARKQDEYYPPAVTEQYPDRLRLRAADVEFHLIEGGHRIPSDGNIVVARWLNRVRQTSR